jgi:hypothetical protein
MQRYRPLSPCAAAPFPSPLSLLSIPPLALCVLSLRGHVRCCFRPSPPQPLRQTRRASQRATRIVLHAARATPSASHIPLSSSVFLHPPLSAFLVPSWVCSPFALPPLHRAQRPARSRCKPLRLKHHFAGKFQGCMI